jgi:D-amino-acid dehydrogenase
VVIVGGGIIGVCAAYFLARRGAPVTLLERGTIDDSASTGNAGLVAAGHGPLPKPGLTADALRWLVDRSGPLYIPLRLDPGLNLARLRWFLAFRRACGERAYRRNLELLAEHGHHARTCFEALVEDESIDCEYHGGQLDVFRTEAGLARARAEADALTTLGYTHEVVDGDELRRREPAFRSDVLAAIDYGERAFANPQAFVVAMADRAAARGAEIRTEVGVREILADLQRCRGVETDEGERIEADHVVLAAGIWSTGLARRLGVSVPMQPGKGYNVHVPGPRLGVACVLAESYVAATPIEGGLRLAGTLEFSGINDRIVPRRIEMLRIGADRYLEGVDRDVAVTPWCGLRPCTADGLPVVGWAPRVERLFLTTGHAMMGFTLGPLAGRIASECILDGTSSVPIDGFAPDRFG